MEVLNTELALIAVLLIVNLIYTLLIELSTVYKWVFISRTCRTIEKRSCEEWQLMSAVKIEFGNFSGLLRKALNNIQRVFNQIEELAGKRTRSIEKRLKGVETVSKTQ